MRKVKKVFVVAIYLAAILLLVLYRNDINTFLVENYLYIKNTTEYTVNDYSKSTDYNYVKITKDFTAHNKDELLNIIYTIVDSGNTEFVFYCDKEYKDCQKDLESVSNDTTKLTTLNNFVHPYNSYSKLYISTNSFGKVTISLDKLYSDVEINYINQLLDSIEKQIFNNTMTVRDKIKAFHDFIINNTNYDQSRAEQIKSKDFSNNVYQSHKANGVLLNHIALCSGYTDIMAIFLDRLNVPNFKISNENHVWNALYIDNAWYHLDLTWDDPVTSNGENLLIYDFFIINDASLKTKDTTQHAYDINAYSEIATSSN